MHTTTTWRSQPLFCLLTIAIAAALVSVGPSANAQTATARTEPVSSDGGTAKDEVEATKSLKTQTVAASEFKHDFFFKKSISNSASVSPAKRAPVPSNGGDNEWHFEVKPYVWLAALDGTLRVGNQTAEVNASAGDLLGMLDFAAAVQVEAIKGRWRIIFDQNYVNLGTTGTGPLGISNIEVEPTMNIFEFGASYMFASVPNEDSTATDPLPPVFTAEVLGGGRFFHFGLELEPANLPRVEGSRNLIGPFGGARLVGRPHKDVSLIGKFTLGGSGAGSNFAWSAEGLFDYRLNQQFSLFGGYRALGINGNQASNTVGFDGHLRGLILGATIYR